MYFEKKNFELHIFRKIYFSNNINAFFEKNFIVFETGYFF